jgi:hypothetical protein
VITELVRTYLQDRPVSKGETIEFGWLILRVREVGPPLELESLDFVAMASFTSDLGEVERIHQLQRALLARHAIDGEPCTLQHSAIVSASYTPGHPDAFLQRESATDGHASGWYLGVLDDTLDMEKTDSFSVKSLYEISIHDQRTLPYWLMPVGSVIELDEGVIGSIDAGDPCTEEGIELACRRPDEIAHMPGAERQKRCQENEDLCIIRGESEGRDRYFVRGVLPLGVTGRANTYNLGVWLEVQKPDVDRMIALWNEADVGNEPPFAARLANMIPGHASTNGLPGLLRLTGATTRPHFHVSAAEHTLYEEQLRGISQKRMEEYIRFSRYRIAPPRWGKALVLIIGLVILAALGAALS